MAKNAPVDASSPANGDIVRDGEAIVVPCRALDGRIIWVSIPRRTFLQGRLGTAGLAASAAPGSRPLDAAARLGGLAEITSLGETLDFGALLDDLGARGIGRLIVEDGSSVHTQLLAAGLADEILLAVAPFFIGDPQAPRFVNPATFPDGPDRRMTLAGVQAVGDVATSGDCARSAA